jgi:DNA-binding CsgD family transcriptional regulator
MMDELTTKQKIVYNMMLTTKTYEDMESILDKKKGCIRDRVGYIFLKLDYSNRTELVSDYYEQTQDPKDRTHNCGLKLDDLESDVFQCMVKGFTSSEICAMLNLDKEKLRGKRRKIIKLARVNNVLGLAFKYYGVQ